MNTENTETTASYFTTYAPTYWNGKGRYQEASDALRKIVSANFIDENGHAVKVPSKGKSRNLAKFQKACWAYCDLFNNGLHNERPLFRTVFGFSIPQSVMRYRYHESQLNAFYKMTDDMMDRIILQACAEQGIHIN